MAAEFSIIVPAYDAGAFLRAALGSLADQTYADWEALIVDDGSTDDTAAIAAEWAARDGRFRLIRRSNGGVSAARSTGIAAARKDWLVFLDADDWLAPEYLARMAAGIAANPAADLLYCDGIRIPSEGPASSIFPGRALEDLFADLTRGCQFAIHACATRRALVLALGGFDEGLRTCEDWDLWLRIARAGDCFVHVPGVLAFYRLRPDSACSDAAGLLRDALTVLRRVHAPDPRLPAAPKRHAEGAPIDQLGKRAFEYSAWTAGLAIGAGHDPIAQTSLLQGMTARHLSPPVIACGLFDGIPIGFGRYDVDWRSLWEKIRAPLDAYLGEIERMSGAPALHARTLRNCERLLAKAMGTRSTVTIGALHVAPVDPRRHIEDLKMPEGTDRLCCVVALGDDRHDIVELPAVGVAAGQAIAAAIVKQVGGRIVRDRGRQNFLGLALRAVPQVAGKRGLGTAARMASTSSVGRRVFARGLRIALRDALAQALIRPAPPGAAALAAAARLAEIREEERSKVWREVDDDFGGAMGEGESAPSLRDGAAAYWERIFTRPDPWDYSSDYERVKYEQTLELLPSQVDRALELACAEGMFTRRLAPRADHLLAADISRTALARAGERCRGLDNVSFRRLDITKDALPSDLDLIVCSEVLYYVKDRAALRVTAEKLHDALRPGGILVMAHANLELDEPGETGFDWWGVPFGAKVIGDVFSAATDLRLEREIRTPLYRVQRFRRPAASAAAPTPPEVIERPLTAQLRPEAVKYVKWRRPAAQPRSGALVDRLPILAYHRIAWSGLPALARYRVTPAQFERQLAYLRDGGFHGVSLDVWCDALARRCPLRGRPIAITFDDGYADMFTEAWPLLRKYGFSATVFVPSDYVGRTAQWDRDDGESAPLLSWAQIQHLQSQGLDVGAHGVAHEPLTGFSVEAMLRDGVRAKTLLERNLARPISAIAYPYDDHDEIVRAVMASCGYRCAVTCEPRRSSLWDDPMALPRIEIAGDDDLDAFARKLSW